MKRWSWKPKYQNARQRIGTWTVTGSSEHTFDTPAALWYTRRAMVPSSTADLVDQMQPKAVQISMDHVVFDYTAQDVQKHFNTMLNKTLPSTTLRIGVFGDVGSTQKEDKRKNGDKFMTLVHVDGQQRQVCSS